MKDGGVERREIARAAEIVGDDASDGGARLLGPPPDEEWRDGDRQRIDASAGDVDLRLRQRGLQAEDDGEHDSREDPAQNGAPEML